MEDCSTKAATNSPTPSYRLVVVMASFDLAHTLQRVFQLFGHTVEIATDGPSALDCVQSMQPDMAITAIELAGFNGFELAKRIRASTSKQPLLLANSSYSKSEIAERAKEAGFDLFLPKPASFEELKRALALIDENVGCDDLRF